MCQMLQMSWLFRCENTGFLDSLQFLNPKLRESTDYEQFRNVYIDIYEILKWWNVQSGRW